MLSSGECAFVRAFFYGTLFGADELTLYLLALWGMTSLNYLLIASHALTRLEHVHEVELLVHIQWRRVKKILG